MFGVKKFKVFESVSPSSLNLGRMHLIRSKCTSGEIDSAPLRGKRVLPLISVPISELETWFVPFLLKTPFVDGH